MTKFEQATSFSRRSVLLGGGALVVSIGAAVSLDTLLSINEAQAQGAHGCRKGGAALRLRVRTFTSCPALRHAVTHRMGQRPAAPFGVLFSPDLWD